MITNNFNASATLAGAELPKGVTVVVWTVTDASGLTATCDVAVTVTDTEVPTITCVVDATRTADAGAGNCPVGGAGSNPTSWADNRTGATSTNNVNASANLAGAELPNGGTVRVWTVADT